MSASDPGNHGDSSSSEPTSSNAGQETPRPEGRELRQAGAVPATSDEACDPLAGSDPVSEDEEPETVAREDPLRIPSEPEEDDGHCEDPPGDPDAFDVDEQAGEAADATVESASLEAETPATHSALAPPFKAAASETEDTEEIEDARMTFLDHLMELRKRLLSAVLAVAVTTILAFVFMEPIFHFLRAPIDEVNQRYRTEKELRLMVVALGLDPDNAKVIPLVSQQPLGLIMILMKVAVCAGLILSSPIVIYEAWSFLSPGLKRKEKLAIQPVLFGGIGFFVAGAAFCYYAVFPLTLNFLVWLDLRLGVTPLYTASDYLGMLTTFMLIFGLVFESPLVASVLAMLGLLRSETLTRYWRHVILVIFVLGSLLSPGGDPLSMLMMSGSMVFLYILSIFLTRMLYPKSTSEAT